MAAVSNRKPRKSAQDIYKKCKANWTSSAALGVFWGRIFRRTVLSENYLHFSNYVPQLSSQHTYCHTSSFYQSFPCKNCCEVRIFHLSRKKIRCNTLLQQHRCKWPRNYSNKSYNLAKQMNPFEIQLERKELKKWGFVEVDAWVCLHKSINTLLYVYIFFSEDTCCSKVEIRQAFPPGCF